MLHRVSNRVSNTTNEVHRLLITTLYISLKNVFTCFGSDIHFKEGYFTHYSNLLILYYIPWNYSEKQKGTENSPYNMSGKH